MLWSKKKTVLEPTIELPKSELILQLEQSMRGIGAIPSLPTVAGVTMGILVMKGILTEDEAKEIEHYFKHMMHR